MGAFADDTTPSEVEYKLESGSGDFRSGTVRMMEGETLLAKASYRNLSASSVTLELSAGAWVTYSALKEKTPQGVEYVDLGLPSGTLWATCNVGATKPEDYGDYFAWGETTAKERYSYENYKYYDGTDFLKYPSPDGLELEPGDDAAYVHWGAGWCMPSIEQCEELINTEYTTSEWTKVNDVNGMLITSKSNGNTLFLPAAGSLSGTDNSFESWTGNCWSRTVYVTKPEFAYCLEFGSFNSEDFLKLIGSTRYTGIVVRPVRRINK